MLNLSFLSEYEQEMIMAVLQRDQELRRIDEKRVRSEESAVLSLVVSVVEGRGSDLVSVPAKCTAAFMTIPVAES